MKQQDVQDAIRKECQDLCDLLIEKNKAYGNSALAPIQIFSKKGPLEQIDVRIDDKLNRIMNGSEYHREDTVKDLIGYLILRRVAERLFRNVDK